MRPVLFHLGPLPIYSFGMMIAAGIILSLFLMSRTAKRTGFPAGDGAFDLVFVTIAAGFAGARLAYILQNAGWYLENPLDIFKVWEGGLIFYGGLIAGFAALFFWMRARRIPLGKGLDFLVPYVALTHAHGRFGCFLNGCCYGKVCDLPWAVTFPETGVPAHPTQIYEAVFDLALFFFLRRRYEKLHRDGEVAALYFVLYAAGRFAIEGLREGNPFLGILTVNQWISIAVFIPAVIIWLKITRKKNEGGSYGRA